MITVYFMHNELTPANVRMTWRNTPQVPAVGQLVGHQGAGEPHTTWEVTEVEWHHQTAATCRVKTHRPEPEGFRES